MVMEETWNLFMGRSMCKVKCRNFQTLSNITVNTVKFKLSGSTMV